MFESEVFEFAMVTSSFCGISMDRLPILRTNRSKAFISRDPESKSRLCILFKSSASLSSSSSEMKNVSVRFGSGLRFVLLDTDFIRVSANFGFSWAIVICNDFRIDDLHSSWSDAGVMLAENIRIHYLKKSIGRRKNRSGLASVYTN